MRSATSYFNGTLYRKTLARFWPLWAGYGVVWLFCIPLNMLSLYFAPDDEGEHPPDLGGVEHVQILGQLGQLSVGAT